jgi:hypothetical protein
VSNADDEIDALFAQALFSSSGRDIGPVFFSESDTGRVYVVDKPFGVLDKGFKDALNFSLIIKEYFTQQGTKEIPDIQRIRRNAAVYSALYSEWKHDNSFPRSEIFARTERRLLCTRDGENVGYEYSAPDALLPAVVNESRVLTNYLLSRPELIASARIDPYQEKFAKSALALAQYVPNKRYGAAVIKDSALLAKKLASERLLPHIDPTSINLVAEDGRLRFIDLEKTTEYLVSESGLILRIH